ncbi:MAG TPA: M28 family peptidase [Longimicrobiales bacterium]
MTRYTSGLLLLAVTACASPAVEPANIAPADASAGPAAAAATITPADFARHIGFLASDALRGRDTPSPGLDQAAEYVADHFERLGLRPAGVDGTYFQRYPLQRRALDVDGTRLELATASERPALDYGTDFFAVAGVPDSASGTPVFTGTDVGRRDAPGALRGRVATLYLPGLPTSRSFGRTAERLRVAAGEEGAIAVLFILDPRFPTEMVAQVAELSATPRGWQLGAVEGPPAFFLRYDPARAVFRAAGLDLDRLRQRAEQGPITPVPIPGVTARFAAPVRILEEHRPPNVVAVLPGSDPALRDTYVVFSAHMDHVGVGRPDATGDSIYNGADDNASGTSALLEVAEAFAALDVPPARSLLFLAVSGEEKGLLGSSYFTDHPTVPLDAIVADLNVDMIGRNAPDSIVVIGQEYSSLGPLVHEVAAAHPDLGLTVSEDLWPEERFFFRSDHFNFARKDIPALFFFAGTHEDYHRPSDEPEKIDRAKAARVAKLIFYTAHEIAMRPEPPQWTEEGLREVHRLTGGR